MKLWHKDLISVLPREQLKNIKIKMGKNLFTKN